MSDVTVEKNYVQNNYFKKYNKKALKLFIVTLKLIKTLYNLFFINLVKLSTKFIFSEE
jgi:hypothetical protein